MSLSRNIALAAAALLVVIASACAPDKADDTTLDRDLTLAEKAQTPLSLSDVPAEVPIATPPAPATKAPAVSRPAPRPAATPPVQSPPPTKAVEPEVVPVKVAAPTSGTIAAGTMMTASLGTRVCTSAKPGEKLIGRLNETVTGSNGVSIPAGATIVLEVIGAKPITDSTKGDINFRISSIESEGRTFAVVASGSPSAALERTRTTETKNDAKKVAGGAVAGAILGQIIGKDTKSTVIGAAAGAAAGTAVAMATGTYEGCFGPNGNVRVTLTNALIIPIA